MKKRIFALAGLMFIMNCSSVFAYNIPKGLRGGLEGCSHSKYQYAAASNVG